MKFEWFGKVVDTTTHGISRRLFSIGDRINYPYYGKGTIVDIELRDGVDFFVIRMDKHYQARILVPMHKLRVLGAIFIERE
jgi:RNA polymerase-interacting CarD/CdnL/TRCF family regulator